MARLAMYVASASEICCLIKMTTLPKHKLKSKGDIRYPCFNSHGYSQCLIAAWNLASSVHQYPPNGFKKVSSEFTLGLEYLQSSVAGYSIKCFLEVFQANGQRVLLGLRSGKQVFNSNEQVVESVVFPDARLGGCMPVLCCCL